MNIKIGDIFKAKHTKLKNNKGEYWAFAIVSSLIENGEIIFIGVKHGVIISFYSIVPFDNNGKEITESDIGQFYFYGKSKRKLDITINT